MNNLSNSQSVIQSQILSLQQVIKMKNALIAEIDDQFPIDIITIDCCAKSRARLIAEVDTYIKQLTNYQIHLERLQNS